MRKQSNGHKICEALGDPTRTRVLQHLLRKYPEAQTISDIEKFCQDQFRQQQYLSI